MFDKSWDFEYKWTLSLDNMTYLDILPQKEMNWWKMIPIVVKLAI